MLFQPHFALSEIRHHLVHLIPEGVSMVALPQMAQLMDHHVVNDLGRRHHALPVKAAA